MSVASREISGCNWEEIGVQTKEEVSQYYRPLLFVNPLPTTNVAVQFRLAGGLACLLIRDIAAIPGIAALEWGSRSFTVYKPPGVAAEPILIGVEKIFEQYKIHPL